MYRVAVIINENEKIHSTYANTVGVIRKALSLVYGKAVADIYSFVEIDKFNISLLFEEGDFNIHTFDSIFVATNACNNKEIYDILCAHKNEISNFIDNGSGIQKGICIANQQKLGGLGPIGFLPDQLSFSLIKRPEQSSYEGAVKLVSSTGILSSFPLLITQRIIEQHCSGESNSFMPHKYRFYIEPTFTGTYEYLYIDDTYSISSLETGRPLLLKSRLDNSRVIISSIILDWAEHLEQIANIMVYITEGTVQHALISKKPVFEEDEILFPFFDKAIRHKIPIKTYSISSLSQFATDVPQYAFNSIIFSKDWSEEEVKDIWSNIKRNGSNDKTFYLLTNNEKNFDELLFRSFYSREFKNSKIFLDGLEWLIANFSTKRWRKSIWTYQYVLDMLETTNCENTSFIEPLYEEITKHFKYSYNSNILIDAINNNEKQSYDNVFNSSCACLNVINNILSICQRHKISTLRIKGKDIPINEVTVEKQRLINWIKDKLFVSDANGYSYQDRIMAIDALEGTNSLRFFDNRVVLDQMKDNLLTMSASINYSDHLDDFSYPDISKIMLFCGIYSKYGNIDNTSFNSLLKYLSNSQGYNGKWGNLSSTAELTLFLLKGLSLDYPIFINNKSQIISMVSSAISYIKQSYTPETKCWVNDENITAKSVHIFALYDMFFNYAIEDFLLTISNFSQIKANTIDSKTSLIAFDESQKECNRLNNENSIYLRSNKQLQLEQKKSNKILSRYRIIVGFLIASIAMLLLFIVWILGAFATQYNEVLVTVLKDNVAIVLSTIIGFVITTIITGVYVSLKNKAIKNDSDEDGKEK